MPLNVWNASDCFSTIMNRTSVFEWHKRFKEGRESVRDDERCGRSKEVRTPEFIGQIKNFMDKDRRVSIETISAQFDVSVETVHPVILEELKIWKICAKFVQGCSEKIRKKDVVMTAEGWSSWSIQITGNLRWKLDLRLWPRVPNGSMLALPDPRRPDRANPSSKIFMTNFLTALAWSTCTGFLLSTDSQQGILCWVFKGVQEDIPGEEASTLQIGSAAYPPGQCTSPQLQPCHRLFDQDGHQDSSSPSL